MKNEGNLIFDSCAIHDKLEKHGYQWEESEANWELFQIYVLPSTEDREGSMDCFNSCQGHYEEYFRYEVEVAEDIEVWQVNPDTDDYENFVELDEDLIQEIKSIKNREETIY